MNEPNIVILAGGVSSRMKRSSAQTSLLDAALQSEAKKKSKAMMSVGINNKPFLDYLLYNISAAGYCNVVIVVGERDQTIREYYEMQGGAKQFDLLTLHYAIQQIPLGRDKPLGTADALLQALKLMPAWKGQAFTVCNSDNLYSVKALQMLLNDSHGNALIDYDRSALRYAQDRITQFAVILKDTEGFLQDIVEKPSVEEILCTADATGRIGVSMNIFRLSYDDVYPFLERVPLHPTRQEKELPNAVRMMVAQHPRSVFTIPLSEHVIDLTSQADISLVQEYLRREFR